VKRLAKIRVYELAKELNTSSSRLLEKLADLGVHKNNHMSYIEEDELEKLYIDLGIRKGESQSTEGKTAASTVKKAVEKKPVKASVVFEPTKDQAESSGKGSEPVKKVSKEAPKGAKGKGAEAPSKGKPSRDKAGSGKQAKGNKFTEKKRETAHSGLLGDMKVVTDDDRMRMLKEKARRMRLEKEKAEKEKNEAEKHTVSDKAVKSEPEKKKEPAKEEDTPVIKIIKIDPESLQDRKDDTVVRKEQKEAPKQEQEAKIIKVTKIEKEVHDKKVEDSSAKEKPVAAAEDKSVKTATPAQEEKKEPTPPIVKKADTQGSSEESAPVKETAAAKETSEKGREAEEKLPLQKEQEKEKKTIKYPARTPEQVKKPEPEAPVQEPAEIKNKGAADDKGVQKKGAADIRKQDQKKKDKKDLDIPKFDTDIEDIKGKSTGERRSYNAKDFEKLDKREQKKGLDKPIAVSKAGVTKKNRFKKPDFIIGQKKGIHEVLSDEFILDEFYNDEIDLGRKKKVKKQKASAPPPPREVLMHVVLPAEMTVKTFSEKIKKTSAEVIMKLMDLGIIANVNQSIDYETASIVADEFGITTEREVVVTAEDILFDDSEDKEEELEPRPPVVVVMGHVDHGKTSLLDAIKKTNVTAEEAGGITQHIGAYMVNINGRDITFLDTPGHEAFTSMRARGAQVTDIAILVVAADDGVMPQTVEAINHAKAAGVSIIVAINKIDSPNANPEKVKQELTEYGLVAEEWGGDTICVPVSALKHENIDTLLEMVLLTADILELKAAPNKQAKGTVIESRLDRAAGPIATLLVQRGTLKTGDSIVAGTAVGRVRRMQNDKGQDIEAAGPSTPVEILGLDEVPEAGQEFYVVEDERLARHLAEERKEKHRESTIGHSNAEITLEDLFDRIQAGTVKELNVIVKADVHGSVEAVKQSLEKLSNAEVKINIIHGAVGTVNESDVQLAAVSNAIIIGFNVRPNANVTDLAKGMKVDMRFYRVIYDAIEDIQAAMKGLLDPTYKEVVTGHVEIRQIFRISGVGTIAGCYVTDGKVARNDNVRLVRDGIVIFEGKLASLKRFKDDVREVQKGYECGLSLENYNDIKEGDIIELYEMVEVNK
jgi:translation initiation factor IF-2